MKMNFENWYNKMVVENQTAVATEITTSVGKSSEAPIVNTPSREDIMSDVDSIMTQLNQLSAQVKEDFNIEILDESLILENSAWESAKGSYGSLLSDPVFQLVGLGIAGVLGALGLGAKSVKDNVRNIKIGKQILPDYNKLKQLELQGIKLEVVKNQLEEKKEQIEAGADESLDVVLEVDPAVKKPAAKPTNKAVTPPANKPQKSDIESAKDKMVKKIEVQINAISKKMEILSTSIETYKTNLEQKYSEERVFGFGAKRVRKLLAQAKDGVAQEVATAKLKFFSETLSDETKEELKNSISEINKRTAERDAEIEKEAKENAEKAKKIASEDEETANALADIKDKKDDGDADPKNTNNPKKTDDAGNKDTKSSGPSDAEKAALAQQDKNTKDAADAEKAKTKKADDSKDKKDGKPSSRRKEVEDQIAKDNAEPAKIINDPKQEKPKKEEPKKEEPKQEKPKKEEPKKEEPKQEKPKKEEPKKEEPKQEKPKKEEEPKKEEPKKEKPKKEEEPKKEEPKKEEPKKEDPSWDKYEEPEIAKGKSSWDGMQGAGWGDKKDNKEPEKSSWDNKEEPKKDTIQKAKDAQAAAKAKVDKDSKEKSEENDKAKEDKKKKSAKESLVISATELGLNELASEINSKLDWQFENNSALYIKYKTQISKAEFDQKINESKYSALSISDRMRILLG